jgi:hypothetical protein
LHGLSRLSTNGKALLKPTLAGPDRSPNDSNGGGVLLFGNHTLSVRSLPN